MNQPFHLTCVVGARPNFMKVAPILEAAAKHPRIQSMLIHTGQHYDERMSNLFFNQLSLPRPDIHLGIGGGNHAQQTARVMMAFDEILDSHAMDLLLVVGDVNSTLACSLVASKREIMIAHVEAGLRSRDRRMPEEINRVLTDQISDLLFTTEREADDNLRAEGIPSDRIFFVGNVMIDTLLKHRDAARKSDLLDRLGKRPKEYAVCTLHRPSNVDNQQAAENTVRAVEVLAQQLSVVFPLHPRTKSRLDEFGLLGKIEALKQVSLIEPVGYLDFLALMDNAKLVFTDSGGIQEETTVLGVPCLTFRENTERPVTVSEGTNQLIGTDLNRLASALDLILAGKLQRATIPELWDGHAAERIIDIIERLFD